MSNVHELPTRTSSAGSARLRRLRLDRLAELASVPSDRPSMAVHVPATEQVLGEVPRAEPGDVSAVAEGARAAQLKWAKVPVRDRAKVLRRFGRLVLDRQDEILDLIQLENGKARSDAFEEVLDAAQVSRYYSTTAPRLLRARRRAGAIPVLTSTREVHHPQGLVGVMSPWNYPLSLGVTDALPALVAGNAVLAKPDQLTPFSCLWAKDLLTEAGLPNGLFTVVTGAGSELGEAFIENTDYLMFTGSTRVGRTLAARAGERLIDSSMELGGKNAMIVRADADLERAVPGAVRACFANTGQLCISVERLYINDTIWDSFVPAFVAAVKDLRLGHSLDWDHDLGPLISQRQLATVQRHVADAVDRGATVLAGGHARPDLGPTFHDPTVLTGVDSSMEVWGEETFGPVVSLYRVSNDDAAIRLANNTDYGLNASIWTSDVAAGRTIAAQLHSGNVNINEGYAATWGSLDAPMGGWGASGTGSRHGHHGLLKYTRSQNVAAQRWQPLSKPAGVDGASYARFMTKALRVLNRLPGVK